RTGSLSSFGSAHESLSDGNNGQQSRSLSMQSQSQMQSFGARPQNAQAARRPPPSNQQQQQQQQQQQRGSPNRPQMPTQQSGRPVPPRPSPNVATAGTQQRPPRPVNLAQQARPMIRTRPPYNGSPASHSQQGSPSPAGSPHPETSPSLAKQPRPTLPQSALHQQEVHMQGQPRRPAPGPQAGGGVRPQPRPQVRPGAGVSATDPSKWLASTMGSLPTDQQERLAGLFRGLQSKTIDFQSFVRDAEAIMGPKFQDLLEIMRNQGVRPPQMQQQQQRPQLAAGQMLNNSQQQTAMRPGHPMSVPANRPGMMSAQNSD
ncbi:hypothetical protein IWW38_006358, partial [Coemansia aciculifera]